MDRTTSNLDSVLQKYRLDIDKAIDDYFSSSKPSLGLTLGKHEQRALDALKEFSLRPGKRIRGSLALFSYDHFSSKQNPSIINLAIALELIQNYLLIIDDVMDRSSSRRGEPSLHKIFESQGVANEHIAQMMAINVGLLAQHMASSLLCTVNEDPDDIRLATAIFHKNIAATGYGQFDDLINTQIGVLKESELLRLYELKASYYTFVNPLQTGAILAGRHEPQLMKHIEKIGLPAGVAFQLQDDILGVFGAEEQTGKSNLDDLREGKITLLILYTLERAAEGQKEQVRKALGNKKLTADEHKSVQSIIEESGARGRVEEKAKSYCREAQEQILSSKYFDAQAKDFLLELLNYVVNRKV